MTLVYALAAWFVLSVPIALFMGKFIRAGQAKRD